MDNFLSERIYKQIHENYKNNDWYNYQCGKQEILKQERLEKMSDLNLTDTRDVVEIWKTKSVNLDPKTMILLEQCVWLSLCVEWSELANIKFDYDKKSVTCSLDKMEVIL